jgi:hypothetical protein
MPQDFIDSFSYAGPDPCPVFLPLLCRILLSSRPACFISLSLASSIPYDPLLCPSLPIPSLHATPLPSPRFAAPRLSLSLSSSLPSPPCCGDKCQICTFAEIRAHVINLLLHVQSSSSYHHCYTLISTRTHARTDSTHAHTHSHLCSDPRMCTDERAHTHLHAHGRDTCLFVWTGELIVKSL